MAHLHKKMKKGRPYYYIREIARVGGKPKVVSQIYLGSLERMMELAKGSPGGGVRISVQEFGALWLANLIDNDVGLAALIDSIIPAGEQETGPSLGEYFLYAVLNRMVDPCSKRALPDWYASTAIQFIRPAEIEALNSQRYWQRWSRVKEEDIEKASSAFFKKVSTLEKSKPECFLFDTTNYYTYMASDTESDLAKRGKNKEGKDWLRQVGVALLVARDSRLPLFYHAYEGNRHDSKVFDQILTQVVCAMDEFGGKGDLTLVFDKGMNSDDNFKAIDSRERIHFITTYSPSYSEDLIGVKLSRFAPVDTPKNQRLAEKGKEDDRLIAFRTTGEYWGRARTVVVTYNPRTAAKQRYSFDRKLLELQQTLNFLKDKVQSQKPHWTDPETIEKHYREACQDLHLPKDLYEFAVERQKRKWTLTFRKNHYRITKQIERFGKNILITDHTDWKTDEIVRASLDRYMVEEAFRQSKDDELVSVMPLRHWTDGKIRCHLFTCVAALVYLRLIELRLMRAGLNLSANTAMEEMHRLHSCLCWRQGEKKPERLIEDPNRLQAQILKAFGYEVIQGGIQEVK
jgi:transposase